MRPTVVADAGDSSFPLALATSDGFVAWTMYMVPSLWIAPSTGGASASVSVPELGMTSYRNGAGLVGDGTTFYAAAYYTSSVVPVTAPSGPAATRLRTCVTNNVPCGPPAGVAVDATNVYFSVPDSLDVGIWRLPRSGGQATKMYDDATSALALSGDRLYWVSMDGLVRAGSTAGGTATTLGPALAGATGGSGQIAVDAAFVEWSSATAVLRVPVGGGTPESIATGQGVDAPCVVASDGANVYWNTLGQGLVRKAVHAAATAPPETMVPARLSSATNSMCAPMAIDEAPGGAAYFAAQAPSEAGDAQPLTRWTILKVTK